MAQFLIENFNTTNQTIIQALPHEKLVVYIEENSCGVVQTLKYEDRCNYVLTHEDCDSNVNYIHYIRLLYCTLNPQNDVTTIFSVFLLILIMLLMFIILAQTADKFFCPPLTALAKWMKMNENLAGLTLLAVGNGGPDLFTSFVAEPHEVGMIFSEGFGGACLVSGLTVAIIVLIRPCTVFAPTFLRNILFFILGISVIDISMKDKRITRIECIIILSVYIVFVVVVVIDQILVSIAAKAKSDDPNNPPVIETESLSILTDAEEEALLNILSKKRESRLSIVDIDRTQKASFYGKQKNENLFYQLYKSLLVIDLKEWKQSNLFQKLVMVLTTPFAIILTLIIPLVDLEEDVHGWSKLLNTLQIIFTPQVALLMYNSYGEPSIYKTYYPLYALVISVPIAVFVFFTTRTDRPPKFHFLFCLGAILTSIYIIAAVAGEVVNVLFTIGMASSCSKSFLGSTLLAAGNSVSDLLANPALAKQGYPKMALAACYGGPMFNILTGLTVMFMKKLQSDGDPAIVSKGSLGLNAMIFVEIILYMTIFALLCTNFRFRRSIGVYILIIFLLHITYASLGEFEIIHPFGTDHEE